MPIGVYERTESHRSIISKGLTGRKLSEEHKRNLCKACTNRVYTKEYRHNLSKAQKRRWAKLTKEERLKCMLPMIKASQERWDRMNKEERRKFCEPRIRAGAKGAQKADRQRWARMTKEERSQALKKFQEVGTKAALKANPSSIEKAIWKVLNKMKIEYKIQVSFNNGKFIVDIYIPDQRLIIECNGDYWHNLPRRKERDKKLKEYAISNDYKLIELWEDDIRKNAKQALENGLRELICQIK